MAKTVIGFFDNYAEAQRAVQKLESKGISRDRIDISSGNRSSADVAYDRTTTDHREEESGIVRFFKSLFGDDDDEVNRYSRVAEKADAIVTVSALSSEEADDAADILDDSGAINVDERATEYGYRATGSAGYTGESRDISHESETSIPRIEENLEVGKRTVERGGVRVRSRIVERPVEETVRLREENVRVERNPVDRPLSGEERHAFREQDIELTERAEVPVVNKEARVVEEVRLSKEVNEREETIRDTVRNTEIDVENLDRTDARYRDVSASDTGVTGTAGYDSSTTSRYNNLDDDSIDRTGRTDRTDRTL
ncbi:YsnF/AvaK domain-containing protein [Paraflavisolibacter sp. H34]|uniref:YsnF/AvaK domain-containing protein n=1 Tax=Huijunlia imazamoxiresistens TaxID=3127457 RepID=UPI00301AF1DF